MGCGPAAAQLRPSRSHNALVISRLVFALSPGLASLPTLQSVFHSVARVNFEITNPAGFPLPSGQDSSWGLQRPPQYESPTCQLISSSLRPALADAMRLPNERMLTNLRLCSDQAVLPHRSWPQFCSSCRSVQGHLLPELKRFLSPLCFRCIHSSDHRRSLLSTFYHSFSLGPFPG